VIRGSCSEKEPSRRCECDETCGTGDIVLGDTWGGDEGNGT